RGREHRRTCRQTHHLIRCRERQDGTWSDTATLVESRTLHSVNLNNAGTVSSVGSARASLGCAVDTDRRQRRISDQSSESSTGRTHKRRVGSNINVPASHSVRTLNKETVSKGLTDSKRTERRRTSRT